MRRQTMTLASTLVAAALLLPACGGGNGGPAAGGDGGSSPTRTGSTAPASSASSSPGGASHTPASSKPPHTMPPERVRHRCHTSQLTPSINVRDSGAGQRHATIVLTNTSDTACTIYGYGGMQLYGSDGDKVPTNLVRDHSREPKTYTLAAGDKAYSAIRWSTVPRGGEQAGKRCEPKAAVAHVTPPDERDTKSVPWKYGPVCDHGRIVQQPYIGKSSITHPA
ncbi:MAG: DUF4232 domain-containing protein [Streptosporangiales bacterium]